jgi:hypothetical protein
LEKTVDFNLPGMDTRTLSESGIEMAVKSLQGVDLKDANGKPVTLKLLGPDSDKYRSMTRAQVRKRFQRAAVSSAQAAQPAQTDTFLDDEADALEILVACTVGWSGVNTTKGEAIPCNAETVRALYQNFPAIRDQADVFMATRANFTKAS